MTSAFVSKPGLLAALLLFLAAFAAPVRGACLAQQNITLQPGWNAIWIGVDPQEKDFATVFAGMPIASVWRWRPDQGGAQYVVDPAEGLDPLTGWYGWYPAAKPEAFLSALFRFEPNTAYLIKLEGTQPRSFSVAGRPIHAPRRWQPDAYTLTGITVDNGNPPSFAEYFAGSPAHQGQPIYKLGTDGRWTQIASPATETLSSNRAYWIRTRGVSSWSGPLRVMLDQGESLEFGKALERDRLVLRNLSGANGSFTINRLGGDTLPMVYGVKQADERVAFPALGNQLVLPAPAGADVFLDLAPKRSLFSADRHEQNFAITDEQGNCVLLAAGAEAAQPRVATRKRDGSKGVLPNAFAGLWLGEVRIDKVSQAQLRNPADSASDEPVPAQRVFNFRVLLHVDADGQARLLKDVTQMWKEGTTRPSPQDPTTIEIDQPGHLVLVTDKTRLSEFSGSDMRDNVPIGQRVSTIAYDFAGDTLALAGGFGPGFTLSADIGVAPDFPTNPFLHRYHPDHDNLDEQRLPLPTQEAEAYDLRREQRFVFEAVEPDGATSPEWGSSLVGGTFSEKVTGLHRKPIFASGRFTLSRISPVARLDQ